MDIQLVELSVTPTVGLADGPLQISISGLRPAEAVMILARLVVRQGAAWNARVALAADAEGSLELLDRPVQELIASLGCEDGQTRWPFDITSTAPLDIEFVAEVSGCADATALARRPHVAAEVESIRVNNHGLSGIFLRPGIIGKHPGVIVLGGATGGMAFAAQTAALVAGQGYASLALAYFGLDHLATHLVEVPLEYFETGIDWFSQQCVNSSAVAVFGRSRGAELALLLGSRFPAIRTVVGYSPSHAVWNALRRDMILETSAWTEQATPIPFASLGSPSLAPLFRKVFGESPVALAPLFEAAMDDSVPKEAVIPVERTNGSILLISGDDDQMWPASRMGACIMKRLADSGHPFLSCHRRYSGAVHCCDRRACRPRYSRGNLRWAGVVQVRQRPTAMPGPRS
jgi:hypothetical protein